VADADGSFVREFTSKECLVVGLPIRCRVSGAVPGGGGALVIAYLDPAVPDMRPLDALRLVDLGFPIPYVDPGGAVRKERDKSSVEPAQAASSGGASVGSDSVAAAVEFGAVSGVPPGACPSESELWAARLVNFKGSDLLQPLHGRDGFYHLVQDQATVDGILSEELPPDEYYCELSEVLRRKFPLADPTLIDHAVPLVAAFDTATAFALSFGIAKFQLAQAQVKLVGEIVSREGRSPNPEIIRAVKKWPPVNTLKDLQAFLGTANYVRAHAGPAYCRVAAPFESSCDPRRFSRRARSNSVRSRASKTCWWRITC
jgi:hypothetical protein